MKYLKVYEGMSNVDERLKLAKIYDKNVKVGMYKDGYIDTRIKQLQNEIDQLKQAKSVETHMNMRGWDFFDISDDIDWNDDEEYYMFVGTRKELCSRIPNPACYDCDEEEFDYVL